MHSSDATRRVNTVRAGDDFAHVVLALAAERAMESVSWFRAVDFASSQNPDEIQCTSKKFLPPNPDESDSVSARW